MPPLSPRYPQWDGFERAPTGRLLEQLVDLDGALGVAYERSIGYAKAEHIHTRHMLVCPRGAAVMNIVVGGRRHRVDGRHVLWVPRRSPHADESVTTLYDTIALYPSTELLTRAFRDAELEDRAPIETTYLSARRSPFFDALLEDFVVTRVVARTASEPFQERQLIVAALRMLMRKPAERRIEPEAGTVGERAIRYIEGNLFLPLTLDAIARHAGASTSTLLRAFREATAQTPYAYVKTRRLDEARHLLAAGDHRVGEVALLVGYEDFGAFSKAFRKQFKRAPSDFLNQRGESLFAR